MLMQFRADSIGAAATRLFLARSDDSAIGSLRKVSGPDARAGHWLGWPLPQGP